MTGSFMDSVTGRRCWLVAAAVSLFSLVCPAQDPVHVRQGDAIRAAVMKLDPKRKPTLTIIGRDLLLRRGVLVRAGIEDLAVQPPKKEPELSVRYQDILQISGRGLAISFIADPNISTHGSWADVKGIGKHCPIGVVLTNGKEMFGSFGGADDVYLRLVGATMDAVLPIRRELIVKVFGITDGKGGVKEYTRKGLKGGSQVGAPEALIVMPVAAGIGSLIGLSKQKKRRVFPVYVR